MSTLTEQNKNTAAKTPDTSALEALEATIDDVNPATLPPPQEQDTGKHRKKTIGELAFDRIVYTGIGFGANEVGALVIGDQFQHGIGKNTFNKISDWMVKTFKFGQKVAKDGKIISPRQNAGNALLTFTLLLDGTMLVWPMKKLEDSKAWWVQKANHWFDKRSNHKLTEEQIATRDKEVEQAIACQPKQSWPSLLIGRTLAVMSTMGNSMFIMGPERMKKSGNFSENLLTSGKFSTQPALPEGTPKNAAHRYAFLIGIETICCAISSGVLEVTSKFFSRRKPQVHDPEMCAAAQSSTTTADASANTDAQQQPATTSLVARKADSLGDYKKKKAVSMDSYTELAMHTNLNSSLVP